MNTKNTLSDLNIVDASTQEQPTMIGVGSTLKNRFILEEELASGGMGSIYRARDLRKEEAKDLNSQIAIKILGEEFRHHPQAFIALERETRRIQGLAHPNIITVYDFDRDGEIVFMTMEYLRGTTLDKIIKNPTIELSVKRVMLIAQAIAAALDRAHERGVIHSDLKPSNVFLCNDGVVKLIDFGIARSAKRNDTLVGTETVFDAASLSAFTPAYASYEMLNGAEPDPRDDIYAFACIIYELLTSQHPYERLSAKEAWSKKLIPTKPEQLSNAAWKALRQGLAIKAEHRPFSATRFISAMLKSQVSWKHRAIIAIPLIIAACFAVGFVYEYERVQILKRPSILVNNG